MIGYIASIATLILFVIYFIGRIISLIIEKKTIFENINIYCKEEDIPKDVAFNKFVNWFRGKF